MTEKNMMEKKKEMLRELTNSVWSLAREYYSDTSLSQEEAKKLAIKKIGKIRYGINQKDYFWITDNQPVMIMHPYRPDLNGKPLGDYEDPTGKKLFVESVKIVKEHGEGYLEYLWQWMDDPSRIVPKISFVKGFEPWGWIIGTGIYIEDVRKDIRVLKAGILRTSVIIALLLTVIFVFLIRQSSIIEKRRLEAEKNLKLSREKYMTLVEASTEGAVMLIDGKVIFSNNVFNKMLGKNPLEVLSLHFDDIFDTSWESIANQFNEPGKTVSMETKIKNPHHSGNEVIITVSQVKYGGSDGYLVGIKNISGQYQYKKEKQSLSEELQQTLVLMHQPLNHYISDFARCNLDTTVQEAARIMTQKGTDNIIIFKDEKAIGIISDSDLRKRALASSLPPDTMAVEIMTSPVITASDHITLFEADYIMKSKGISHLLLKDQNGDICGVLSRNIIFNLHKNTFSFLLQEIEDAKNTLQLKILYNRLPVIVDALLSSGSQISNITRFISKVSDAITRKIISLAIEKTGPPPCRFAFIAMGSEGRMEQTLATDQDNAIIIENQENQETVKEYFLKIGKMICTNLDQTGFHYCKGNIMAMNPVWVQPLETWKNYFSKWINTSNPEDLLESSIFFDLKNVYGEASFVEELRQHVSEELKNKSVFFLHLALSVINFRMPSVSQLSGGYSGEIDIKKVIFPVTGLIRILSLRQNIQALNSLERLDALYENMVISKTIYEETKQILNFLTYLRIRQQTNSILHNETADNIIDLQMLTEIELTTLKKVISKTEELQDFLKTEFKTAEIN